MCIGGVGGGDGVRVVVGDGMLIPCFKNIGSDIFPKMGNCVFRSCTCYLHSDNVDTSTKQRMKNNLITYRDTQK